MQLEIVTPDKQIFSGEVSQATFPGANGTFQVLENHAAIVSPLVAGSLKYTESNGNAAEVSVTGGVVEVSSNVVTVLAEGVN